MTNEVRDIQRKLKVLQHAEKIGNARKVCRYFGVGRSSFYRWRDAYQKHGEAGLKNAKSIPKNPADQTSAEIVEKVLYLRRKYHLGPIRIVWYLARYGNPTVLISRSSINFSVTKATWISRLNWMNGNASTTSLDHTARTTDTPLTKLSETSYSSPISVPKVRLGYTVLSLHNTAHNCDTPSPRHSTTANYTHPMF